MNKYSKNKSLNFDKIYFSFKEMCRTLALGFK